VTAANVNLMRCIAGILEGEDEDLRLIGLGELVRQCLTLCDEEPRQVAGHGLYVAAIAKATE